MRSHVPIYGEHKFVACVWWSLPSVAFLWPPSHTEADIIKLENLQFELSAVWREPCLAFSDVSIQTDVSGLRTAYFDDAMSSEDWSRFITSRRTLPPLVGRPPAAPVDIFLFDASVTESLA